MTSTQSASPASRAYDNNGQYSRTSILRYEKIFGPGYISTGGHQTTLDLCARLGSKLAAGARILDVGSGIGGAAYYLANAFGAHVTGVDLSPEMIHIAHEEAAQNPPTGTVTFLLGDILELSFDAPFDIIWSRDALMHIPDKTRLFSRLFELTAPGCRLVITDYARGTKPASAAFDSYIKETGYHVTDPASYGRLLAAAGFVDVIADDATAKFIAILRSESERLATNRAEFLGSFTEQDLNYLVDRWAMKVDFCQAGDMKWGIYQGTRRA